MEYKQLKFKLNKSSLNEAGEFEGYAAYKNNVDSANERIVDGAFRRTTRNNKEFPILWFHQPDQPLGLTSRMSEDANGLFTKGMIDLDTELGKRVYSGMRKGYIDRMSIGFSVVKDDYDSRNVRELKEIKLGEVSLITKNFAANDQALLTAVKSKDINQITCRLDDLEKELKGKVEDQLPDAEHLLQRIEELEYEIKRLADSLDSTRPTDRDPDDSTLDEVKSTTEYTEEIESDEVPDTAELNAFFDEMKNYLKERG